MAFSFIEGLEISEKPFCIGSPSQVFERRNFDWEHARQRNVLTEASENDYGAGRNIQ
jgi:hypothetical protein